MKTLSDLVKEKKFLKNKNFDLKGGEKT